MMRKADIRDAGAIAAFLEVHVETSMFLLGNLEAHGVGNHEAPHGTAFFLRETGDKLTGVFGATNSGYLMCQLPGLTEAEAQTCVHLLKGRDLVGMTGEADQVAVMLDALPVAQDGWQLNQVQPLYHRALAGLISADHTRSAEAGDVAMLTGWFASYLRETQTCPAGDLMSHASARAEAAVGAAHIRLLIEDGQPMAMAAINARAGRAVQVGGVFVADALRGMGRGGRVTAALLAEAAVAGADLAILFAASPSAARVYERIGFERCGAYRLALLKAPMTMGEAA
ncbi:GNAT family N-acetyltransferase [Sagittula sp. NFXS13]|uniref:GNAT family N-acetyltransferase n=1 Tax=Sagittula sp. NFXS13 TaxID=2819095 RepID=UPI0032DE8083